MWAGKKWLKLCRDGRKFRTLDASSDTVIKISPMQGGEARLTMAAVKRPFPPPTRFHSNP